MPPDAEPLGDEFREGKGVAKPRPPGELTPPRVCLDGPTEPEDELRLGKDWLSPCGLDRDDDERPLLEEEAAVELLPPPPDEPPPFDDDSAFLPPD